MFRKVITSVLLVLLTNIIIAADKTTSSKSFPEFRKKAAKVTAYSPEDYALGVELLKAMKEQAKTRKMMFDRTMLFARTHSFKGGRLFQCRYYWYDRPLFASRMLWEPSNKYTTLKKPSFRRNYELIMSYGLDGISSFMRNYRMTTKVMYDAARNMKADPKKFHIMMAATPRKPYQLVDKGSLDLILNSPYSFRLNGESVMASYDSDSKSPEVIQEYIKEIEGRSGGKKILLIVQLGGRFLYRGLRGIKYMHPLDTYIKTGGAASAVILLHYLDYISKYLRVSGGVEIGDIYNTAEYKLNEGYYNNIALPLFGAAIAQDEFNGKKILMNRFQTGYTSYHGAQTLSRDGTKTLRKFLEMSIKNRIDIILGVEWDELNEDTHIEPTVAKPMSSQRIVKYYTSKMRKEAPTPNLGDDLSLPNMIISQRRQLTNGWTMDVELLNVPDTNKGEKYSVVLELLDAKSKVVFKSKKIAFNTAKLKDRTFKLSSERFASCQLLQPRLTIKYKGKKRVISEGLPFTVLRPTTSRDHTYFCTPLRNVLFPIVSKVTFKDTGKMLAPNIKELSLNASLKFADELNAVEVVQDSYEIYAYDPKNEWLQNDPDRRLYKLSQFAPNNVYCNIKRNISNAPSVVSFEYPVNPDNIKDRNPTLKMKLIKGFSTQSFEPMKASVWNENKLFSIKKQDIDKAVLTLSGMRVKGPLKGEKFEWRIPLKALGRYGIKSKVFEDGLGFSLETQYRPTRVPLPLDCKNIDFKTILAGDQPNGIIALRAVSNNGKVYWSKGFAVNDKVSKEKIQTQVYSSKKGRILLNVPKNLVPDIKYNFTPKYGNILYTSAGREFYGHIGASTTKSTGFQGIHISRYGIPRYYYSASIKEKKSAPVWEKQVDGKWALRFDGKSGNFLSLPNTVVPQRAGFTMVFEIKPDIIKPKQLIFAQNGAYWGGFRLSVEDGKFKIKFAKRTPHIKTSARRSSITFDSNVPLVAGKWQKVTFKYDEKKVTISANGKTQSFPCKGIGRWLTISAFGGEGKIRKHSEALYQGLLRSLEVKHTSK